MSQPHRSACWRVLVVAALAVLLAACGGSSASSGRDASELATVRARSGLPTPTASPTRVPPTPTATATVPPTATPLSAEEAELAAGLLSDADLRAAWTDADPVAMPGLCALDPLDTAFTPLASVSKNWSNTSGGILLQSLVQLAPEDVAPAMEHARQQLACDSFETLLNDSDVLFWTLRMAAAAEIGDEIVTRNVDITYSNPVYTPMTGSVAIVRVGNTVATLLYLGYGPTLAGGKEQIAFESLVRLAVARLDESASAP